MPSNDQSDLTSSLSQTRLEVLHEETREELAKADAKATTLTSIVGLILGAFLAGAVAGDFSPQRFSDGVEWLFWTGIGLALAAEVALCSAIFPRTEPKEPRELLDYFAHVARFETREMFKVALASADSELERLINQVYGLSKTVVRKYYLIRLALFLLAAGGLSCMASSLLDHYLFRA